MTECNCPNQGVLAQAHFRTCPVRIQYEHRIRNLGPSLYAGDPAYFCVEDREPMKKWKEGDYCLAHWREGYRQFQIVTIRSNNAYLHATSKHPGERITVRTIRRLDVLKPLPYSEQKKMITVVQALTLIIPFVALVGMIYLVCKPSTLDEDK